MKTIGVVLSAGVGARFKNDLPKQYHILNGKTVISYVIDTLRKSSQVDDILVMCGDEYYCQKVAKEYDVKTLIGGATRNMTVKNALNYITESGEYNKVLFLDSARPNQKVDYIDGCVELLDEYDCVITTQYITDSLGSYKESFVDRKEYYLIQTPECFKVEALKDFDENSTCTAIVQQLDETSKIYCNYNLLNNIKITYENDIALASIIMKDNL